MTECSSFMQIAKKEMHNWRNSVCSRGRWSKFGRYVQVLRTTLLQLPEGNKCGRQTLMMEAINPSETWKQSNSLHGIMCQQTVASVGRDKPMPCIELEKGENDRRQAYVISVRGCERKGCSVTLLLLGAEG